MTTLTYGTDGKVLQDGKTPDEWLKEMYEYEVCAECGWDADRHIVILSPVGNFFAMCRDPIPYSDPDPDTELARRIAISTKSKPAPPSATHPATT